MKIKVIGAGCNECARLYENTLAAVRESGIAGIEIEKVEDLIDIADRAVGFRAVQFVGALFGKDCSTWET